MSDYERVVGYMMTGKPLTVTDCLRECGTTELRTYVLKMTKQGIPVEREWVQGVKRDGSPARFKRYRINEKYLASLNVLAAML